MQGGIDDVGSWALSLDNWLLALNVLGAFALVAGIVVWLRIAGDPAEGR
jgi:hypothetical protein